MAQAGPVVWGRFRRADPPVQGAAGLRAAPRSSTRPTRATISCAATPCRPSRRCRSRWRTCSPRRTAATARSCWSAMQDYNHYAAIGVLGEILPDERNYVSTPPDREGPVRHPGAVRALQPVRERPADDAGRHRQRASGAARRPARRETHSVNRYAHLVGTCRMGFTPRRFGGRSAGAAPGTCPTCWSATAACCRPRARPTRR